MRKSPSDERSDQPAIIFGLACILFLICLAIRLMIVWSYNADYGAVEMNVIYGIQRIIEGQPLYQNPSLSSYAIMQYMPLHYYAVACIAKMLNVTWLELQHIYILARAFSLILNLTTIAIIFNALRKLKFSLSLSLISSLSVLIILTWHYYLRNDSSQLLFFVWTIYFMLRYLDKEKVGYLVSAAIVSACCVMSKQNGVLIVAIIGFYLFFIEKKYRQSIFYLVFFFICTTGLLVFLVGTDLQDLYSNVYLGLKNGASLRYFNRNYFFLIPCFVLWGIILLSTRKFELGRPLKFIVTGGTISFLFAAITCIKLGSDINYFVEFLVFLLLAIPYCLTYSFSQRIIFRLKRLSLTLRGFTIITLAFLMTYKTSTMVISNFERKEREFNISSKSMGLSANIKIERKRITMPEVYKRSERLLRYFKEKLLIEQGEHVFIYYIFIPERNFLDNFFIEYSVLSTKDVVSQVVRASAGTFDYSSFTVGQNNGLIQYIVSEPGRDIFEVNDYLPFVHFDKNRFQWMEDIEGFSIYKFKP